MDCTPIQYEALSQIVEIRSEVIPEPVRVECVGDLLGFYDRVANILVLAAPDGSVGICRDSCIELHEDFKKKYQKILYTKST